MLRICELSEESQKSQVGLCSFAGFIEADILDSFLFDLGGPLTANHFALGFDFFLAGMNNMICDSVRMCHVCAMIDDLPALGMNSLFVKTVGFSRNARGMLSSYLNH